MATKRNLYPLQHQKAPAAMQSIYQKVDNKYRIDLNPPQVTCHSVDQAVFVSPSLTSSSSASASPQNSSLGIIAENSSTRGKSQDSTTPDPGLKRLYRMLDRAAVLLPDERIAQCSWRPAPLASHVVGGYNARTGSSYLTNLTQCESYACPYCALVRSESDRHELSVAMAAAQQRGLFVLLITHTMSHHTGDRLGELRSGLSAAYDATYSGRWYRDLVVEYGIKGKIKSWETTFGLNGWHPHLHVLVFLELELTGRWLDELKAKIYERYQAKLAQVGLDASYAHGVDVRSAESDIADYIAKWGREPVSKAWGADAEIAKSPVKRAHLDGLTPMQLLAAASGDEDVIAQLGRVLANDDQARIVAVAGDLYCEYFHAFKGRPRIHWGRVKGLLELDQALEAYEVDNPVEDKQVDLVLIERGEAWGRVLALPDGRAELRAVLSTGDAFKVLAWFGRHGIAATVPDEAKRWTIEREKGFSAVEPVEPHKLKTANGDKPAAAHRQSGDVGAPVYIGPEGARACRGAGPVLAQPDVGSVAQAALPGLLGWVRFD